MTGQQLLDEKKADTNFEVENKIVLFRKTILDKGLSECYATTAINCVRGFYAYYRTPLVFRKQESKRLNENLRTTTDYLFDREDLSKMALAGSLKERYVLLVGKSLGMRAGDFIKLTFGQFRSLKLDSDPPVAMGQIGTGKERIIAYPFLDSDAVPIVKLWLDSHKDKKDTDRMLDDGRENLSVVLQTLATKSGLDVKNGSVHGKRVRFHCLRKFLIDRLSAYAGESQWKQIVGKAISEGAYVSQDQLQGVYLRAMKDIVINGNGVKVKKLVDLENALTDSQKRLGALEITNEALRKELSKTSMDLGTVFKQISRMKPIFDNLDEITEFLQERAWQKEQKARAEAEREEQEERREILSGEE